ncbi:Der GTPase-activating protein YihI [Acerihabitans sp. KWT182]|uniref:Der GTPase-activating protein YihI n=1 Tax=Acerihabitans sp. KWT182 TaxID=3157919 RepID=A0AAU7QAX0_9GAMM
MKPIAKSGRAKPAGARNKRKTREELNIEGRARQRQKKRRGLAAGSRAQEGSKSGARSATAANADPRIGSKKPVPLMAAGAIAKPTAPKVITTAESLSPQAELDMLENDARLDALLLRLEQDESLSAQEQAYVDEKLDRIDRLMTILGIELDEEDEEEPQNEDMLQLLKRGFDNGAH